MGFYFITWQRCFDFYGRSPRKEFWAFMLVHLIVTIGCVSIDIVFDTWLDIIYSGLSVIPTIAAIVRRLHDIGKSSHWGWVFFIPVFGPFILIYLLSQPSNALTDKVVNA
ncbi:DUF805 domain-containing protein [Vibrio amylolyticus]|uniref:DUF805 domain-containing protein n=1 Tax=Vibrio amylolyticus TaxID=2847292 RepID=UPI0035525993